MGAATTTGRRTCTCVGLPWSYCRSLGSNHTSSRAAADLRTAAAHHPCVVCVCMCGCAWQRPGAGADCRTAAAHHPGLGLLQIIGSWTSPRFMALNSIIGIKKPGASWTENIVMLRASKEEELSL
eukprot:1156722-Pelagomonas_calceolata.AAC.3